MTPLADADAEIVALVEGARFVGIGEARHGSGGIAEVRNRLTALLIERADVRAVAIEAPYVRARAASAWLERCEGPPGPAARGFGHPAFTDVASAELLVDLCAHNRAHPDAPVRVFGFDSQDPGGESELAALTGAPLADIRAACPMVRPGDPVDLAACDAFLAALPIDARWPDAVRQAFRAWVHRLGGDPDAPQLRDDAMAALLLAQADADVPDGRIVLWAHDGHLAATEHSRCIELPGRPCRASGVTPMGASVERDVGDAYRVLALAAPELEVWSRDGRSSAWSPPPRAFERHAAPVPGFARLDAPVTGVLGDVRGRLDEAFDAVVVIDGGRAILCLGDVARLERGQPLTWRTTTPDAAAVVARALAAEGWEGGPDEFTRGSARADLVIERRGRWTAVTVTPR